jgi:hypothetical protein
VPNWTKKNFSALRDVSPPDVPIQWRFARTALESPELGVSRFTYEPGARMPWGHRHREQEEVYVVVSGSGRAKLCNGARKTAAADPRVSRQPPELADGARSHPPWIVWSVRRSAHAVLTS